MFLSNKKDIEFYESEGIPFQICKANKNSKTKVLRRLMKEAVLNNYITGTPIADFIAMKAYNEMVECYQKTMMCILDTLNTITTRMVENANLEDVENNESNCCIQ